MKIINGKQKIGLLNSATELVVDYDDLFKYKGFRTRKNKVDKAIGYVILVFSLLVILISLFNVINSNQHFIDQISSENIHITIALFLIYPIIYSFYLLRDKTKFSFTLEESSIYKLKKRLLNNNAPTQIEAENYFSENILQLIDEAYFNNFEDFIANISFRLLNKKSIQKLVRLRLGIENIEKLKSQIKLETASQNFQKVNKVIFLDLFRLAFEMEVNYIDYEVLFIHLLEKYWIQTLNSNGIVKKDIEALKFWLSNQIRERNYIKKWKSLSKLKPTGAINRTFTSRATPLLDILSADFTAIAAKTNFVLTTGREDVMNKTLEILTKQNSSAVLLIGEPGTGKTHFLKYLATRLVIEDVPKQLSDKRLIVLNLNTIFAKSKGVDEFKNNLSKLLLEVNNAKNIILGFEEIGQIFTLRDEVKFEIINLIGNIIDENNLKVVLTTTPDDYNNHIKNIKSFSSLFEIVNYTEPSEELSLQILLDSSIKFEKKYNKILQLNALKELVKYSYKINYEKAMPDKGLELLEESFMLANIKNLKYVDNTVINEILHNKTGAKIGKLNNEEAELLQKLEIELHKRVVGQTQAISSVANALRRIRAGLTKSNKPLASFLFYGPTGVGKTEVAKTIAKVYYGNENLMVRLNMSEYNDENNLKKLLGYYDQNKIYVDGVLTSQVKKHPFSLILLDELEKANYKVLDLFLSVLDEGYLNDNSGKRIDFTNNIIIATSNAASQKIAELITKNLSYNQIQNTVKPELYNVYRVEFLNRFDKVIMFKPLTQVEIETIANLQLQLIHNKLLNENGITLTWDNQTLSMLAKEGYDSIYGARELKRTIQDYIEDNIAKLIIENKVEPGAKIVFSGLNIIKIE